MGLPLACAMLADLGLQLLARLCQGGQDEDEERQGGEGGGRRESNGRLQECQCLEGS